jgi:trehalose 6-phosphate synthase/phosphatase
MTPKLDVEQLQVAYKHATTRIFFLDYDGTLSPIRTKPEDATPSRELIKLLTSLSSDPHNFIYIISGRDRNFLQNWIGDLPIGLCAEHGAFIKPIDENGAAWRDVIASKHLDLYWKGDILAAFKRFCDQVPNSFIETKEYAITLHYRNSSKEIVKPHKQELKKELEKLEAKYNTLDVRKGKKSLEARVAGITKGTIIKDILNTCERSDVDFVICIGDDVTDEDMFAALAHEPELRNVFTCTVGRKERTCSNAYLEKQSEVLDTLHALTGSAT